MPPGSQGLKYACKQVGVVYEVAFAIDPRTLKLNRHSDNVLDRGKVFAWIRDNWRWSYPAIGAVATMSHSSVIESIQKAKLYVYSQHPCVAVLHGSRRGVA